MSVRSFHHIGLSVADLDLQCRFYSRAFGFREEYRTEIPEAGIRICLLAGPGGALELTESAGSAPQHFTSPADGARTQGYFHWALTVPNLDDALTTAVAHGAQVISEPRPTRRADARFAYLADPEHNLIELLQPTR
jgi:catechol 2,3-dioxygenase-like lactoylglutathione lyase family enzyme